MLTKSRKRPSFPFRPIFNPQTSAAPWVKPCAAQASRQAQAQWQPPENRPDPIDLLIENSKGRVEDLVPIRYGRMMASPFAFYRGAAAIMASDLSHTPSSGLNLLACGDSHLVNFGGFATTERKLIFDINDFDECSFAPWEWDVKRLGRQLRHCRASQRFYSQ